MALGGNGGVRAALARTADRVGSAGTGVTTGLLSVLCKLGLTGFDVLEEAAERDTVRRLTAGPARREWAK